MTKEYSKRPITNIDMFRNYDESRRERIMFCFNQMNSIFTGNHKNAHGARGISSRYLGYSTYMIDEQPQFGAFHFYNFQNSGLMTGGESLSFTYLENCDKLKFQGEYTIYGYMITNIPLTVTGVPFDSEAMLYNIPPLLRQLSFSSYRNRKIIASAKQISSYIIEDGYRVGSEIPYMYKVALSKHSGLMYLDIGIKDVISSLFNHLNFERN